MSTNPTSNSIPSESPRDLKFNAGKIDEIVNSQEDAYRDRLGISRLTWKGIENYSLNSMIGYGYITAKSFESGYTLTLPNQVLLLESEGNYYRWDGQLPKSVSAGSTPETAGGEGPGLWAMVGDASIRSDLNSSSAGLGASLVSFSPSFSSAVPRSVFGKLSDRVSVKDFGAKGNGLEDDTQAFIKALSSDALEIFIPEGDFRITSQILRDGGALRLFGAGNNVSRIICDGVSDDALLIRPKNGDHFIELDGFTMVSRSAPVTGKYAIRIDASSQLTSATYNGIRLVGEREKRRAKISNIDIRQEGDTSVNGFYGGLRLTCMLNFSISSMTVIGPSSSYMQEAFAIDGEGVCVDIRMRDCYAYNANFGLNMPDYVEALYLDSSEFVNVTKGISSGVYQASRSVLSLSQVGSSGLKIGPMHVNSKLTGMEFNKADFIKVRGCLHVISLSIAPSQATGISITNTNLPTVNECSYFVDGDATTIANNAVFGVVLSGVTNGHINDNDSQGANVLIKAISSSNSNTFDGNKAFWTQGATAVDADQTCLNNEVGKNIADGSNYNIGNTQNRLPLYSYVHNADLTIAASASQVLTVPIPGNKFFKVPKYASMSARNGSTLLASYNYGASTKDLLSFTVFPSGGGIPAAGVYGFTVFAADS